jgi:hypothetical protein
LKSKPKEGIMEEETQKKLLEAAKKAMAIISVAGKDHEFVFEFRDLIRKADSELKKEHPNG